jgi:hypothetical protein
VPDAQLVCLSYFGSTAKPAHVRYQIRRFKRALPQARFLACFWMLGGESAKVEDWKVAVSADFVATSLDQAALICAREMRDASAGRVVSLFVEKSELHEGQHAQFPLGSNAMHSRITKPRTVRKTSDRGKIVDSDHDVD